MIKELRNIGSIKHLIAIGLILKQLSMISQQKAYSYSKGCPETPTNKQKNGEIFNE